MSSDESVLAPAQASQMLRWLDEEHRRDQAELAQLRDQLERVLPHLQELANRLDYLNTEQASLRQEAGQLPQAWESIRQLIAQAGMLERGLEEHRSGTARLLEGQQSTNERLQRELTELRWLLEQLQQGQGREQVEKGVFDEALKRLNGSLSALQYLVDEQAKKTEALNAEMRLREDARRREEGRLEAILLSSTELQEEHLNLRQQVELLETRWTRQLTEGQERFAELLRAIDGLESRLAGLVKTLPTYRNALEQMEGTLTKEHETWEEQSEAITALQSQRQADREAVAWLREAINRLDRRLEQNSGVLKGTGERLQGLAEASEHVEGALHELLGHVGTIEMKLEKLEADAQATRQTDDKLARELHAAQQATSERDLAIKQVGELHRRLADQIAGLALLGEQQRRRHVAELERQVRELQEHRAGFSPETSQMEER
ncbi:MAG: hypothetical protein HYX89_04960 [Chloroflexi bacterium]|nr:hypothetical protein [Chloroflexota bacterium]